MGCWHTPDQLVHYLHRIITHNTDSVESMDASNEYDGQELHRVFCQPLRSMCGYWPASLLVLLAEVCHFASSNCQAGNCRQSRHRCGKSWQNKQSVRVCWTTCTTKNLACTIAMVEPEASSTSRKGRPPPKIVSENFRQVGKVNNKSNRWYYECIHCNTAEHIEGRDNNHIRHLTDTTKCPNVPAIVRNAARTYLAMKSAEAALPDAPLLDGSSSTGHTVGKQIGKRGHSSLLGYVDHSPLTTAQQERVNIKLFRSVTIIST